MIIEYLTQPFEFAAELIDLIGIAILLVAAMKFLLEYAKFEVGRFRGLECALAIRDMRLSLGSYILLALEFMIISDVINSAITRTMEDFIIVGILVLIRSTLAFFLGLDLKEVKENA